MPREKVNVVAVFVRGEKYVFLYDRQSVRQVHEAIGRAAANPDLSFDWIDAALACESVRRQEEQAEFDRMLLGE